MESFDKNKIKKIVYIFFFVCLIIIGFYNVFMLGQYKVCTENGGTLTNSKGCIEFNLKNIPLCKTIDNKIMVNNEYNLYNITGG